MNSKGFKPLFFIILSVLILAYIGISINSKSENENKLSLTQKLIKKPVSFGSALVNRMNKNPSSSDGINEVAQQNLLVRERIFTQSEIENISESDFNDLVSDIERKLPRKSDIKKIPVEALHHTPPLIIEAGRNLGLIKEILKSHESNKSYEKIANSFYLKCSNSNETPTTVRAICLTNLIIIANKNGTKLNTNQYPREIVDLSKIVTDL
jgi:hypothetical protein